MNQRLPILLAVAALALSSLACQAVARVVPGSVRGSGNVVSEERAVSGFSAVDFGGLGDLFIELGQAESLTIAAEDNLLPYLETNVRAGRLEIRTRQGVNLRPREPLNFYLTVVSLDSLNISGLGNVRVPVLEAGRFSVAISGGGDLELEALDADELVVSISGLGNLSIGGGEVAGQTISISGGGNYTAGQLASRRAVVHISGLGNAILRVSEELNVDISGGGSVRYHGSPSVSQTISGLGNVEQVEP
jgi:hypothetical protein